jgi:hypothetical protein
VIGKDSPNFAPPVSSSGQFLHIQCQPEIIDRHMRRIFLGMKSLDLTRLTSHPQITIGAALLFFTGCRDLGLYPRSQLQRTIFADGKTANGHRLPEKP